MGLRGLLRDKKTDSLDSEQYRFVFEIGLKEGIEILSEFPMAFIEDLNKLIGLKQENHSDYQERFNSFISTYKEYFE